MIGEECVRQAFDVQYFKSRAITVVFLPMDKLEQERPFLSLAACPIYKMILTHNREEFCPECWKMYFNWLDRDNKEKK